MSKFSIVQLGTLAVSSVLATSAYAFNFEVVPETPIVKAPVQVAPGQVTMPMAVPAPKLDIGGFQAKAPAAKPVSTNSCEADIPDFYAAASKLPKARVMELLQKGVLAAETACEMGVKEFGDDAIRHLVVMGDVAEKNGINAAAEDQIEPILIGGLDEAFRRDGQKVDDTAKRVHKIRNHCKLIMPPHTTIQ